MRTEKSNKTNVDKTVDSLNQLIQTRLEERSAKPLITSPEKPIDESTKLDEVIKTPKSIIDTGKPLEENKVLDTFDKTREEDVIELLKPNTIDSLRPAIRPVDSKGLPNSDRRRLYKEEFDRRKLDDARGDDLKEAFNDELERRRTFQKELELMKLEFDLYLKETYPDIVGDKIIKSGSEVLVKQKLIADKKLNEDSKNSIKKKMVTRVESEKLRKQKENRMLINTRSNDEISTFLEEEIIIEQQEKKNRNPEIRQMNTVQKQIKEVKEMEIRMGRPIVPHRDIVESEDSDFDKNSLTKSSDILIKGDDKTSEENYKERRDSLEQLRQSLNDRDVEEDFAVKLDKEDRQKVDDLVKGKKSQNLM